MRAIDADKIDLTYIPEEARTAVQGLIDKQPTVYDLQKATKKLDELIFNLVAESTFFTWRVDRRIVRVLEKVRDIMKEG